MEANKYSFYLTQAIITAFVTLLGVFLLYKTVINNQSVQRTFTVEGTSEQNQVPQIVSTEFSISERGATQKDAQSAGDEKQKKAMDMLLSLGFKKEDIKTTGYYINEDFDYTPGGRSSKGFIININTSIKSDDVEKINKAISSLPSLGINIGGVSYSNDPNDTTVQQKIRESAIKNAREKADAMAKAAGFRVGRIVNINEWTDASPGPLPYAVREAKVSNLGAAPADIQPGSSPVTTRVSITYEIN